MASSNQGENSCCKNPDERTTEESGYITRSEFFNCFRELIDTVRGTQHGNIPINLLHSTPNRPFHEELNIIEEHERRAGSRDGAMSSPLRQQTHGNSLQRSTVQESRGPGMKMPNYDGSGDIDVFFIPFDRLAERFGWSDKEKVDRLFQCLQGPALKFLCGLPADVLSSYAFIKVRLARRFTNMDQPATLRRQLADMRQKPGQLNEEFAEEVNKIVVRV